MVFRKYTGRTDFTDWAKTQMDYILGELVKALQAAGQLENTLIVLTSDNGPECEIPPHARSPFRGCKGSSWECAYAIEGNIPVKQQVDLSGLFL